ncbi:uncharacterized protein BYT42DRAFT_170798 [Radiomyces spectabilis]|uniref:uncharacterized protein n=1 Tax=Radiomyces spectabilis TaxID=64574 RepID=UPI00222024EF|nr:uncharacterized protein BYT42DRAFT_170798 [Radiomyces spectabilis]KAI8390811.1 hypothetical protein BYT42DRAFT_170798 [Radiomyces spectabilis]
MVTFKEFLYIYLTGGLTLIPALLLGYLYLSGTLVTRKQPIVRSLKNYSKEPYDAIDDDDGKRGWIRITNHYQAKCSMEKDKENGLISGIQLYMNNRTGGPKKQKTLLYGALKHGTLFCYDSSEQQDCQLVIPVHNYTVSLYPEGCQEGDLFSRSSAIVLRPKNQRAQSLHMASPEKKSESMPDLYKSKTEPAIEVKEKEFSLDKMIYLYCARAIDKEDWYLSLRLASTMMDSPGDAKDVPDSTQFDMVAMHELITTIQRDPAQREMQWLNALVGRLFLGTYKTAWMQKYWENKIIRKVQKVKRPNVLDEIHIQTVDVGQAIPYITQPKLLSLSLQGDLILEANIEYAGGLAVVIETGFHWSYSSRLKPIRVNLVLSVMLKKLRGKFMIKIKPPPTNRCWIGFYEMPYMEWEITPIVSDKEIKLNMVTNAIESKIREVISENIVLPNMDDFPFWPSEGLGGIFGDSVVVPPSMGKEDSPAAEVDKKFSPVSSIDIKQNPAVPSSEEDDSEENGVNHRHSGSDSGLEDLKQTPNSAYVLDADKSKSTPNLRGPTSTSTAPAHLEGGHMETASIRSNDSQRSGETASMHTTTSGQSNPLKLGMSILRKKARWSSGDSDNLSDETLERRSSQDDGDDAKSTTSGKRSFLSKISVNSNKGDIRDGTQSEPALFGSKSMPFKRNLTKMAENLLHKNRDEDEEDRAIRASQEQRSDQFAYRIAEMKRRSQQQDEPKTPATEYRDIIQRASELKRGGSMLDLDPLEDQLDSTHSSPTPFSLSSLPPPIAPAKPPRKEPVRSMEEIEPGHDTHSPLPPLPPRDSMENPLLVDKKQEGAQQTIVTEPPAIPPRRERSPPPRPPPVPSTARPILSSEYPGVLQPESTTPLPVPSAIPASTEKPPLPPRSGQAIPLANK